MSSAFPCGTPSTTSNSTTSPSSFKPASKASVPPIWPAPIRAIFLRAMGMSSSWGEGRERRGSYRETGRAARWRGPPSGGGPSPVKRSFFSALVLGSSNDLIHLGQDLLEGYALAAVSLLDALLHVEHLLPFIGEVLSDGTQDDPGS